jgi:NAD-dependent dihydropyrimidine dehydrogenase PreA subunit
MVYQNNNKNDYTHVTHKSGKKEKFYVILRELCVCAHACSFKCFKQEIYYWRLYIRIFKYFKQEF